MTLSGTVINGVVVLDSGPIPPEGTKVEVMISPTLEEPTDETGKPETPQGPHAWMLKYAGVLDLPADFAEQHDHYIHGTPKR